MKIKEGFALFILAALVCAMLWAVIGLVAVTCLLAVQKWPVCLLAIATGVYTILSIIEGVQLWKE